MAEEQEHTDDAIRGVCVGIVAIKGARALTRAAVQLALKAQAVELWGIELGADNGRVGRIMQEVLAEEARRRQAPRNEDGGSQDDVMPAQFCAEAGSLAAKYQADCDALLRRVWLEERQRVDMDTRALRAADAAEHTSHVDELRGKLEEALGRAESLANQVESAVSEASLARADLARITADLALSEDAYNRRIEATESRLDKALEDLRVLHQLRDDDQQARVSLEVDCTRLRAQVDAATQASERAADEIKAAHDARRAAEATVERLTIIMGTRES